MTAAGNEDPGSGAPRHVPLQRGQKCLYLDNPLYDVQVEETQDSLREYCEQHEIDGDGPELADGCVAVRIWNRKQLEDPNNESAAWGWTSALEEAKLLPISEPQDLLRDACSAMCDELGWCDSGCNNERREV